MTNEEMVYYLEHADVTVGQKCKTKTAEAIEKALKIIKSQPCEDCISREEAIRIAEQGQIQGYEWQFKKLCNLPSVTPKVEWIPVSERLPEEDGMYLISTCMNCIDTCLFYKDDDEYLWVDYEDSVIAWMPLPSSYQGE